MESNTTVYPIVWAVSRCPPEVTCVEHSLDWRHIESEYCLDLLLSVFWRYAEPHACEITTSIHAKT